MRQTKHKPILAYYYGLDVHRSTFNLTTTVYTVLTIIFSTSFLVACAWMGGQV